MRDLRWTDHIFIFGEQLLEAVFYMPEAQRDSPAKTEKETHLSFEEKKLSANLLRVDHAGEVCAQALYMGHALTARNKKIRSHMLEAAKEERDHLAWCAQRLYELDDHISYLNPCWYLGSFAIGALSGLLGDEWNLGFVAETEHQVEAHLKGHLELLPSEDKKSQKILLQMQKDEMKHAKDALAAGGKPFPFLIKKAMSCVSKVMTTLAYYI